MNNILSTSLLNSDQSVSRPQTGSTAPSTVALVSNASLNLSNASIGALIKGIVSERHQRNIIIQTDKGSLTIVSDFPLKVGNEVVLQLQSTGTQTRVLILSVDGRSIDNKTVKKSAASAADANTSSRIASEQSSVASKTSKSASPVAPRAGAVGSSISPTSETNRGNSALNSQSSTASAGATAQQGGANTVVHGPIKPGLILPANVLTTEAVQAGDGVRQSQSSTTPTFNAGDRLTIHILSVSPAGKEPATPHPVSSAATTSPIQSTVIPEDGLQNHSRMLAQFPDSTARTVVSTPKGKIAIGAGRPGPDGTKITLEILDHSRTSHRANGTALELHRVFSALSREWPTLKEAIAHTLPQMAGSESNILTDGIPQPGKNLTSTLLFFMAALKSGHLRDWLGHKATAQPEIPLQGQTLAQLTSEFTQISRLATEPQPSGWQIFLIPLSIGGQLDQAKFYYRHLKGSGHEEGAAPTKRFVVEVDITRLGLLQLDGLVRPDQFDLICRCSRGLDTDMQRDIRDIFTEALEIGGMKGMLRFENGEVHPLNPFSDNCRPAPQTDSGVVI